MADVRVRLYGLVSMTRRRYLTQVAVALLMAAGLLAAWWFYWPQVRSQLLQTDSPTLEAVIVFWNMAPAVIFAIVLLQLIEAWYVMRIFERKEADLRKKATTPPPQS